MGIPTQPICEDCRKKPWRYLIAGSHPDGFFEIAVCEDCLPKYRPQWDNYIWDTKEAKFLLVNRHRWAPKTRSDIDAKEYPLQMRFKFYIMNLPQKRRKNKVCVIPSLATTREFLKEIVRWPKIVQNWPEGGK